MIQIGITNLKKDLSDQEFYNLRSRVSKEKWEKSNRYKRRQDAQNTLFGEIMAREMISQITKLPSEELSFLCDAYGKPFIEDLPDVYFNISHTEHMVVCAISDALIGIDIQVTIDDVESLASRFFTEKEQEYLLSAQDVIQKERFVEIWCKKESYLKWSGKGLSIPLESFDVLELYKTEELYFTECFKRNHITGYVCSKYDKIDEMIEFNFES